MEDLFAKCGFNCGLCAASREKCGQKGWLTPMAWSRKEGWLLKMSFDDKAGGGPALKALQDYMAILNEKHDEESPKTRKIAQEFLSKWDKI